MRDWGSWKASLRVFCFNKFTLHCTVNLGTLQLCNMNVFLQQKPIELLLALFIQSFSFSLLKGGGRGIDRHHSKIEAY